MLNFRITKLTASLLCVGCFLLIGSPISAGDKTKSIFTGKATEIKLKDGKGSYSGELSDKDGTANNKYYKVFTVKFEKDKTYRIDYLGDLNDNAQYDAYLYLEEGDGSPLAEDDDSGGGGNGLNSRLAYKAVKSGTYRIITTTFIPQQTGKFKLEIVLADEKDSDEANLKQQLNNFGKLSAKEQQKLVVDITKRLQDKGADLAVKDAMVAIGLLHALEDVDIKAARETYKVVMKTFEGATNKQLNGFDKFLATSLKKLDKIGQEMQIAGKTTDGKEFDMKNLKGKVILVDFWGTWCPPCVAEVPNIVKAYEKYHGKGFEVIGIASDKDDDVVVKFMEARKLPWMCINVEDSRKLIKENQINSYPSPFLIGRDGRIVSTQARGERLERLLERLLNEKN